MAKKASKKKRVNRKLKRTVRKTLSAVFMITALIVAAIPVQDNVEASSPEEWSAGWNDRIGISDKLEAPEVEYTVTAADDELGLGSSFKKYTSAPGYVITETDGLFFKDQIYKVARKGNISAITGYNVNYNPPNGTLTIPTMVAARYEEFSENDATARYMQVDADGKYSALQKQYDNYYPDNVTKTTDSDGNEIIKRKIDFNDGSMGTPQILPYALNVYACDLANYTPGYEAQSVIIGTKEGTGDPGDISGTAITAFIPYNPQTKEFYLSAEDSYPVSVIADDAFSANTFSNENPDAGGGGNSINITNIVISDRITTIGDRAFKDVSALKSITLGAGIQTVGNHTFEGCSGLQTVNFSNVKIIGTEAFKDCTSLSAIKFTTSLERICPGAFNHCTSLSTIDMKEVAAANEIGDFAFYNCPAINTVEFSDRTFRIGKGAFAVPSSSTVSGGWTQVVFPVDTNTFGDSVMDGRINLAECTLPAAYGGTAQSKDKLGQGFFRQCMNLNWVKIGGPFIDFEDNTFLSVVSEQFYVEGPATNNGSPDYKNRDLYSLPRLAAHNAGITYKFMIGDVPYFEIASRDEERGVTDYYLINANTGALEEFRPATDDAGNIIGGKDIVIKGDYNGVTVKSVAAGCFDDVKDIAETLTVEDNTISEISNDAFNGFSKLKTVVLGNSVTKIGDNAFKDCRLLEDVYFNMETVEIGKGAFETNTDNGLTFHGKIAKGFAPFDWAMERDNDITTRGTRVLYEGLPPVDVAAIYDKGASTEENDVITLMYYPLFQSLDEDNAAHCRDMEKYYYERYAADTEKQAAYLEAVQKNGEDSATAEASYGPWITPFYAAQNSLTPYFTAHPYSIEENFARGTAEDASQPWLYVDAADLDYIQGATEITIPEGITSINSVAYYGSENSNANNASIMAYIDSSAEGSSARRVKDASVKVPDGESDCVRGLFSGWYDDYKPGVNEEDTYETQIKGNDYITKVTMQSVTSIPDYAFDSCEKLKTVDLGPACKDIGMAPFRGCIELEEVIGNDTVICENDIIYTVNEDGTYTLVECLPSRGKNGNAEVSVENDPKLASVTKINDSAFIDCRNVVSVNLSGCNHITNIPKDCFKGCYALRNVVFPVSVNYIEEGAFKGLTQIHVTIPSKEVYIHREAFEHGNGENGTRPGEKLSTVVIQSYPDSAAFRYTEDNYIGFETYNENEHTVTFLNWDFSELYRTSVKDGASVRPFLETQEEPTRSGYKFTGWATITTGATIDVITTDTIFIAQFNSRNNGGNNGGVSGNGNGNNGNNGNNGDNGNNGNNGKLYTVTVINGSGSGSYVEGADVIIAANNPAAGYQFKDWTVNTNNATLASNRVAATTFKMPAADVKVTANYEKSKSSGSSVSGNSSNGNNSSNKNNSNNGTKVVITRPGISDTDLASANVNGSRDGFIVKISETAEATAAVEQALTNKYGSLDNVRYAAMDISLYDSTGTVKITDTTGYTIDITIPIPDVLRPYAGNNRTAAVVNSQLEELTPKFTTIDGVPCVTFRATHFSPYTVYVDTGNLSVGGLDNTPKTGDGIHPKWFLAIGLACLSVVLFMKKDKKMPRVKTA